MVLTRVLLLGSTGNDVGAAQSALGLVPDNIFSAAVDAAVRDYQNAHNLAVDGRIGPITWASLMTPRPLPSAKLDAVGRLVHFAGMGKYVLGAGGTNSRKNTPFTWKGAQYGSDCAGFVLWGLGCSRHHDAFPEYEGDINTDSALMDAGLAGLGGAAGRKFFAPLSGPMHPGVCLIYRSVWRRDMPADWVAGNPGKPGDMIRMGHFGMVVGWDGLKNPEKPEETPWNHRTESLVTVECCYRIPAVRVGRNQNFVDGSTVHGMRNPDWGVQFVSFVGPVEQ